MSFRVPVIGGRGGSMRGILTIEETAYILAVTPKTVRKWLRQGLIPGKKLGGRWRIHEAELVSSFRTRKNEPFSDQQNDEKPGPLDVAE